MRKVKGSWMTVGIVTSVICCFCGIFVGWFLSVIQDFSPDGRVKAFLEGRSDTLGGYDWAGYGS